MRLVVVAVVWVFSVGVVKGFTPKDSGHCVQWGLTRSDVPIRAEANHGSCDDEAPVLCQPQRSTTAAGRYSDPNIIACTATGSDCTISIGEASNHLDLGTVHSIDGGVAVCVPLSAGGDHALAAERGTPAATEFLYATIDPTCDVWWREVSADVIPPIPELVRPFGATLDGRNLALCRSFGDDTAVDDGRRVIGTIALEGPDFGRCFITRIDGSTTSIDGGLFHVLQARAAQLSCADDEVRQVELRAGILGRIETHLTPDDRTLIQKVTQSPFAELLDAVLNLGSCSLAEVLSAARFVPHALNSQGLHLLRCLLAERIAEARAAARGYNRHPDYPTWKRDGLLVKNWDSMVDADLHALLQMVSGEETLGIPLPPYNWVPRNVEVATARDPQNDMHVDTFAHIVKIWVFPQGVTMEQGPLHYFKGSNRNTEGKLRWMYRYGLPPASEAMIEPSFRLLGCFNAVDAAPAYVAQALLERVPLLSLAGANATLVIADTSGLHNRGVGVPGHLRHSFRLAGDTDGGLKRLDPFRPIPS